MELDYFQYYEHSLTSVPASPRPLLLVEFTRNEEMEFAYLLHLKHSLTSTPASARPLVPATLLRIRKMELDYFQHYEHSLTSVPASKTTPSGGIPQKPGNGVRLLPTFRAYIG
ncbi:hypothetical protein N7501_010547 [Penicillium viridicatum]|nr:hypothetical protein N7501_010547 [Penicillium viridicatum]